MVMAAEDAKAIANSVPQVKNKKNAMISTEIQRYAEMGLYEYEFSPCSYGLGKNELKTIRKVFVDNGFTWKEVYDYDSLSNILKSAFSKRMPERIVVSWNHGR